MTGRTSLRSAAWRGPPLPVMSSRAQRSPVVSSRAKRSPVVSSRAKRGIPHRPAARDDRRNSTSARVTALNRRDLPALAGAAILAAFSVAALPFSRGLFRAPRTPFDASAAAFSAGGYVLLQRAGEVVPQGASVVVRAEPPDPMTDTYLHRFAVALLPGRKIVPAAVWGIPREPETLREAQYEIVLGRPSALPVGRLVLGIPEGTIWRRDR